MFFILLGNEVANPAALGKTQDEDRPALTKFCTLRYMSHLAILNTFSYGEKKLPVTYDVKQFIVYCHLWLLVLPGGICFFKLIHFSFILFLYQQSQSSGGDGHSQGGTNPPLPSTPNGPPYQNIHENGTVQAPPSPQDGAKGGSASPITRTGTIDRQLPAIPPIGAVGPRKSMDYDGDYDTIRTGKDEDYDCTYALVKEKDNNISPIAETESDYADVPDVRRRPMPNNFGEYADVDNSKGGDAGKKTSGGVQEGAKSPKVVPVERIAPRAEPEPDISDAEYAVVDIKEARTPRATAATPSTSKDATELYASVKVGKEQGAVGGAQVKKVCLTFQGHTLTT